MSVTKRLKRLTGEESRTNNSSPSRTAQIGELRRRIEDIMTRRPVSRSSPSSSARRQKAETQLDDLVGGQEVSNSDGQFFLSTGIHHPSSHHGHRRIGDWSHIDMSAVAFLSGQPEISRHAWTDGLFLDTETTGLAGGTGTLAFLIGLGWFEGDAFVTRQIFARDFSEEKACLSFLTEIAAEKRFLVTFNGKAFDVGLLTTRFIMNRMRDPLSDLPHLDLLHPARRLVGHRLENSRLGTLEEAVLGLYREDDVPGHEIPQRYFDWLKRRDPAVISGVFEHNRLDVLSMAGLTCHLADLVAHRCVSAETEHRDLLAVARLRTQRKDFEGAKHLLETLIGSDRPGVAARAGEMLSLIYKSDGHWHKAVEIWEQMILGNPCDLFAVEELSKWNEHRMHHPERAYRLVKRILEESRRLTEAERDALVHRLHRLKGRMERRSGKKGD